MNFSTKRMGFPRYRDVQKLQQMISYGQINYLQWKYFYESNFWDIKNPYFYTKKH